MSTMAVLRFLRSRSQCQHRFSTNTRSSFSSSSVYHCFSSSTCGRPFTANPTFKTPNNANLTRKTSSSQLAALSQIRWAAQWQGTPTEEESGEGDNETGVVYHDPYSSKIKQLKLLSLCPLCLSLSPVLITLLAPDMTVILKGVLVSIDLVISATIFATLNWLVSPFIHKLRWVPGYDRFEVEMLSWLAIRTRKIIKFADIRPPGTNRPFVTFKANAQFYFVNTEHFHNKKLLARLTSQKGTHDSAFKNF